MRDRRESPPSVTSLTQRLDNEARRRGVPVRRLQRAVANTVVGQMLPLGVVKGGTALKLRVGEVRSRFSPDFDVSRDEGLSIDGFVDRLIERSRTGWGGFTGTVERGEQRTVPGVPVDYVMVPLDIRLAYRGRHWLRVELELGRDEVDSTRDADLRIATDLRDLFAIVGLDDPSPVAVQAVHHQVVQKLHACTSISPRTGGNDRAHDLVDLQILLTDETLDPARTRDTARRLFASRRAQDWPPVVRVHPGWPDLYAEAATDLEVLGDVDAAVAWANELITRIEAG